MLRRICSVMYPGHSSRMMYRAFPQVQESLTSKTVDEPQSGKDERKGTNDTEYGSEHGLPFNATDASVFISIPDLGPL